MTSDSGVDFAATRRRLFALYGDGEYANALRLAETAAADFPDHEDQTTYWTACLQALLGDDERALAILEDGRARGLWWPPEMLEGDPDLASVRAEDCFRAIVTGSAGARASMTADLPTEPLIVPPDAAPVDAVVVLIHGRGETVEEIAERWRSASRRAMLIAPRSTQPFGMRTVCWDDAQRAEADVLTGVNAAMAQTQTSGIPVVTAGFSQGAGLAVVVAARRRLPGVVGVIGVAPSAGWALDLLGSDAIDGHGLRGELLLGDQDPRRDDCERLAQRLRDAGVEVRAEVIEGLGHDYPPDFEDRLPEVLDWMVALHSEGLSA